jgi:hypothetical protein
VAGIWGNAKGVVEVRAQISNPDAVVKQLQSHGPMAYHPVCLGPELLLCCVPPVLPTADQAALLLMHRKEIDVEAARAIH